MQTFVTLNQVLLITDGNFCEVNDSSTRGKQQLKAKRGPMRFGRNLDHSPRRAGRELYMLEMRIAAHLLQLTEVNEKSEWTKVETRIKELPQKH